MYECEKVDCTSIALEKAYDKVKRVKMWSVLSEKGVEGQFLNGIRALYAQSKG